MSSYVFCCSYQVIHAVYPALVPVELFYQITSAPAQAFYYLIVMTCFVKAAYSFDIRTAAACITHIGNYSFNV